MDMMSYLMGRNSGGAKKGVKIEVVTELPETGEANVIYLVPKQDEDENNVFDEYLYINNEWELIGTTDIDLSNYYTKSEIDGKLPPIYVLNTTNQLNDGNGGQTLESDAKIRYNEIITDAYTKGYKSIAILLCSTSSGKNYMFYSNNIISTSTVPIFYADCTFKDKNNMDVIVRRLINGYGTWNNGVFTLSGNLTYDVEKKNLLYSNNNTAYTPTGTYNPATKKYVDDNKGQTIQYETMPTASADYVGKIVQYTGTTDSNYTNGYFYICVSETENDVTTYSWSNLKVQSSLSDIPTYILAVTDNLNWYQERDTALNTNMLNQLKVIFQDVIDNKYAQYNIMFFANNNYRVLFTGNYAQTATAYYQQSFVYSGIYMGQPNNPDTMFIVRIYGSVTVTNNIVTSVSAYIKHLALSKYLTNNYFLQRNNAMTYDVTGNYNPAHKLYVDTKALTNVGLSPYSTSVTYQEGDYVYRSATDPTIYKCNTADTTGTWDGSKWDTKTYMEYLSDTLVGGALNGSY